MAENGTPRKMVSFRLPISLIERWNRISYILRRPKGSVAQDAIEGHLDDLERQLPPERDQQETPDARS
jgi:predicted DNA-binding protein